MKRAVKFLSVLALILGLAAIGSGLYVRGARGQYGAPTQIKPGLWKVTGTPLAVSVFAVRSGAKVVLIDTGTDPAGGAIDSLLSAAKATRPDVSDVLITHAHLDHMAGAALFPKARLWAGEGDVRLASREEPYRPLLPAFFGMFMGPPPATVTNKLSGRTDISVGDAMAVKVFPVPGHTRGSVLFLSDGVLFTGDTIMQTEPGVLGLGPPGFDWDRDVRKRSIIAAVDALKSEQVDRICPSHNECTEPGKARAMLDALVATLR